MEMLQKQHPVTLQCLLLALFFIDYWRIGWSFITHAAAITKMKTVFENQMEKIEAGIPAQSTISEGVSGIGGLLLITGFTLAGPLAAAAYGAFPTTSVACWAGAFGAPES